MEAKVAHGYVSVQAFSVAMGNTKKFRSCQPKRMAISDRIRSLRLERNEDQIDVATAVGVSRVTVTQWEGGTKKPSRGSIAAVARHFGVSVDYLLGAEPQHVQPTAEEQSTILLLRKAPEHVRATVRTLLENTASGDLSDTAQKN